VFNSPHATRSAFTSFNGGLGSHFAHYTAAAGVNNSLCRLDITTMFKIREWERYKFMIDYEHEQASE
jgi:hypothetical protein